MFLKISCAVTSKNAFGTKKIGLSTITNSLSTSDKIFRRNGPVCGTYCHIFEMHQRQTTSELSEKTKLFKLTYFVTNSKKKVIKIMGIGNGS